MTTLRRLWGLGTGRFGILIVLLVKPSGIFGKSEVRRV